MFNIWKTVLNKLLKAYSKSIIIDVGFKDGFISNKYLKKCEYIIKYLSVINA